MLRSLRIATTFKEGTANARYRAEIPLRELARRGHSVVRPSADGSFAGLVQRERPPWDVALVQQATGDDDLAAVRRLRELGVAVVWDSDDDVRGIPRNSPAYHRAGGRRGVRRLFERTVEIARTAHLMTTPSAHLAELYRAEGARHVAVIENYLPNDAPGRPRTRHAGVVVGVVGALEHERDLEQLRIGAVLKELLARQPDVRVVAIGCGLGFDDPRCAWHRVVPPERLEQLTRGFDIGLAPLADGTLARSRSNVKLKEYAAGGAAWLASPIGPYVALGEEQGGQLVADGDWLAAIERLVVDPRRRVELATRARGWAARQTISSGARVWERELRAAIERARDERRVDTRVSRAGRRRSPRHALQPPI
ncbi:hypothetical protein VSS74_13285 [Conexibacter stalactiti]|uniref:Glycosyltransferase n=1 Tax=Conexibacter stalactiti TaxID=1940611 RepID=A0ABU4HPT8_9ACTN|nr:hypothetical protein [Conexibacter stalactiti]MDW5595315.1 hypothetical protein [Conexibacter stalactiti]MEC5035957.1 hypothetical protein [Conexibacter stalactiti]